MSMLLDADKVERQKESVNLRAHIWLKIRVEKCIISLCTNLDTMLFPRDFLRLYSYENCGKTGGDLETGAGNRELASSVITCARIKCKWAWQQRTLTWIRIERFPGRWQMCPSPPHNIHISQLFPWSREQAAVARISLSSLAAGGQCRDNKRISELPLMQVTLQGKIKLY